MVGDHQIKGAKLGWNIVAVKCLEGEAGIFSSDGTSGITEHAF